jgi:hypothetical protein
MWTALMTLVCLCVGMLLSAAALAVFVYHKP